MNNMEREALKTLIRNLNPQEREELENLIQFLVVVENALNQPAQPIIQVIIDILNELNAESEH